MKLKSVEEIDLWQRLEADAKWKLFYNYYNKL